MNRTESFLLGIVLGVVGLFAVMHYTVIRADDGFHVIPKISARLEPPYQDIRNFQLPHWQQKQSLALSILKSKKGYLLEDHRLSGFKFTTQQLLDQLTASSRKPTTRM